MVEKSYPSYLEKMKQMQTILLNFIECESNMEENYQNLIEKIESSKICDDKYEFKSLLYLIIKIYDNYHRFFNEFSKIERILLYFKDIIKIFFSNSEIFHVFKSNKRILLFLIEEQIMNIDEKIAKKIVTTEKYIKSKYPQYFQHEIQPFMNSKWFPKSDQCNYYMYENSWINEIKKDISENFFKLRKIGENEDPICNLIRQNLIKDFIVYINKHNISPNKTISPSIYETNNFLINIDEIKLIEYAAFFGSIEIFNYLRLEKVNLEPSLWLFAIHGQNSEIIHFLEDNSVKPENESYNQCLIESIKCHHNDITNYLLNNFCEIKDKKDFQIIINQSIKYYNFAYIQIENINESSFYYLCKYDHYLLVDFLLKTQNLNINEPKKEKEMNKIQLNRRKIGLLILGKTAFYSAVKNENIDIVKLLLTNDKLDINILYTYQNYDDVYFYEKSAFYLAVENENIEIIKLLSKNEKLDINLPYISLNYDDNEYFYEKTALYLAVEEENIEIIKLLLMNEKLDVNISSKKKKVDDWSDDWSVDNWKNIKYKKYKEETAFYLAVEKENIEIIKLLLENDKLDINIPSEYKSFEEDYFYTKTAFYLAVEKENIEIIKLLLENDKLDINIPYEYKNFEEDYFCTKTAFYLSFEKENIEIIKLLLTNEKLDINIPYKYQHYDERRFVEKTIFYSAVEKENIEIIKLLLAKGKIDINTPFKLINGYTMSEKTAFYLAVENKNIEIIKILLSNEKLEINISYKCKSIEFEEADIGTDWYNNYICWENEWGDEDNECERIIKTAFYLAVENESIEIIKLLLTNERLDANIPFIRCQKYTEFEDIKKEEIIKTAFYFAIEKENIEIIKLLLANEKIDINIAFQNKDYQNWNDLFCEVDEEDFWVKHNNFNKKTPFYLAVEKENIEIIKLLLTNEKLDINIPLIICKKKCFKSLFKGVIIKKTAFYLAVEKENIEIIKLLLMNEKLEINIPYKYSIKSFEKNIDEEITPLHLTVKKENIVIIKLLLNHKNIDVNAEDNQGKKPIDYTKNKEIILMLNH